MQTQNWDYLHVVFEQGRPRYVNDQEIPNWQQGPALFDAVNHLFRNGWELVDYRFAPISSWLAYRRDSGKWVVHYGVRACAPGFSHHFRPPKR